MATGTSLRGFGLGGLTKSDFEICCTRFSPCSIWRWVTSWIPIGPHIVSPVAQETGRFELRAWLGESSHPGKDLADKLRSRGSLIEWSSGNLLVIGAAGREDAQIVADVLVERAQLGHLVYEAEPT